MNMMSRHEKIVPLILAGGAGTRLWPMSRSSRPKQFLTLIGEHSLFQQALLRVSDPVRYEPPIIVTNNEYRFLVADQAQEIGVAPGAIVLEPVARNTAPAIIAGTLAAQHRSPSACLYVLASDHAIIADRAYHCAIETAHHAAHDGKLVTFGITPTGPATGFGYIEAGKEISPGVLSVARFVEKPDVGTANAMIAAGGHYWNSGMFMFRPAVMLDEAQRLTPAIVSSVEAAIAHARRDLDFLRLDQDHFAGAEAISIDYAIFEKSDAVAVVPAPIKWSDLGSWDAVWQASERDGQNNALRGSGLLNQTSNALVVSENQHVVVDGLDDVAVLASEDAIYVGRLSSAQNVGEIVKVLKAEPKTLALAECHRTMYRPWGGYSSVLNGERFQVKRLFVKPGKRLSLQKHHHRAEHWVVVRGTAEVQVDEDIRILRENESIYIPQGAVHRLANPGKILLELIEVQTGSYLGEDDIIRLDDEFGRT
ncbi:mannose-1-phosphate guanylyltransferase [Pelagibacterium lentulum]|uniref:mannose-1-phosphate guanylyltransferase n=2 Tax=Pelagibacterium lentulum TaxID=2029865 RepID=A0A916RD33_9HYPH|nr:mannose-1-phosphate guanylyltransferase [Pelagibacterium lentulum]